MTTTTQTVSQQTGMTFTDYLERNELGDAELFEFRFTGKFIYDQNEDGWYSFAGHYWERDKGRIWQAIGDEIAGEYLQEAARMRSAGIRQKEDAYKRRAQDLRSRKRVTAVLDWAKTLMTLPQQWDRDPLLLPCANGVIDLQNGTLRPGKPEEYLRAHSPTYYPGVNKPAPMFEAFVRELFNDNQSMIEFTARVFGYAISGQSNEKKLPICYGSNGNNGKTTLIEIISDTLGSDFCTTASADVLMEQKNSGGERPSPFIVSLPGKRIFWAKESRPGQRFNLGLVKEMTGGDTLAGRGMYQKNITVFRPSHVVFLVTNSLPHVDGNDNAAWDRLIPIEFKNSFVDNPDPQKSNEYKKILNLREKMKTEAPAILAWLVRGCLEWQHIGIQPPNEVTQAAAEYRTDEDDFGLFITEKLTIDPNATTPAKDLYIVYRAWAIDYGMFPMGINSFGSQMAKRFKRIRTKYGNVYSGVGV